MSLDTFDRRLLAVLQKSGRISNADLAEKVNLSASACHRRVQRLEQGGYIAAHVALPDTRRPGICGKRSRPPIPRVPDVPECRLTARTADHIQKIAARSAADFARIRRLYLTRLPSVAKTQSSLALRTVCQTTALPV